MFLNPLPQPKETARCNEVFIKIMLAAHKFYCIDERLPDADDGFNESPTGHDWAALIKFVEDCTKKSFANAYKIYWDLSAGIEQEEDLEQSDRKPTNRPHKVFFSRQDLVETIEAHIRANPEWYFKSSEAVTCGPIAKNEQLLKRSHDNTVRWLQIMDAIGQKQCSGIHEKSLTLFMQANGWDHHSSSRGRTVRARERLAEVNAAKAQKSLGINEAPLPTKPDAVGHGRLVNFFKGSGAVPPQKTAGNEPSSQNHSANEPNLG